MLFDLTLLDLWHDVRYSTTQTRTQNQKIFWVRSKFRSYYEGLYQLHTEKTIKNDNEITFLPVHNDVFPGATVPRDPDSGRWLWCPFNFEEIGGPGFRFDVANFGVSTARVVAWILDCEVSDVEESRGSGRTVLQVDAVVEFGHLDALLVPFDAQV